MRSTVNSFAAILMIALSCQPAAAWMHAGPAGVAAGNGHGSWGAVGRDGGTASGHDGSWQAHGAYGGSAYGNGDSWHATGAYGNTAYGSHAYYGGAYGCYHPPVVVNTYGSGCYNCGGWSSAGAAAAGAVVGLAAGAAIGAAAAENQSPYAMGAIVSALPSGCVYQMVGSAAYYNCSHTWFTPSYGANGVYYRVVPTP